MKQERIKVASSVKCQKLVRRRERERTQISILGLSEGHNHRSKEDKTKLMRILRLTLC